VGLDKLISHVTTIFLCVGLLQVVHVGEPYTLMDFSQESGRGGRNGESVESVVFVSSMEPYDVHRDEYEEMMRRYITTRRCRMRVLSEYLDTTAVDCTELGGRPCDLCQARQPVEDAMMDDAMMESREQGYDNGRRRLEQQVKQTASQEELARICVSEFMGHCASCLVWKGVKHSVQDCKEMVRDPDAKQVVGLNDYVARFKAGIKYQKDTCCFKCSVPGDWCESYRSNEGGRSPCQDQDSVLRVAAWVWLNADKQEAYCGRRFENVQEFRAWLAEKCAMFGTKSHNGFKLFCKVVEDRKRMILDSLRKPGW
jgi:superfamily II DNA helicase RecQ